MDQGGGKEGSEAGGCGEGSKKEEAVRCTSCGDTNESMLGWKPASDGNTEAGTCPSCRFKAVTEAADRPPDPAPGPGVEAPLQPLGDGSPEANNSPGSPQPPSLAPAIAALDDLGRRLKQLGIGELDDMLENLSVQLCAISRLSWQLFTTFKLLKIPLPEIPDVPDGKMLGMQVKKGPPVIFHMVEGRRVAISTALPQIPQGFRRPMPGGRSMRPSI